MRRYAVVLLLIGVVVSGCGSIPVTVVFGTDRPTATSVRATSARPTPAPPTAPPGSSGVQPPRMPANLPGAKVVKVIDGDTIDVALNGQTTRVRLIGINTPETVDPR